MKSIATLGPKGSTSWLAAQRFAPEARILLFPMVSAVIDALTSGRADLAMIPVYNTREGEIKEYFKMLEKLDRASWVDNIVLPIDLSLGALDNRHEIKLLIGKGSDLRQCGEYLAGIFPSLPQMAVHDTDTAIEEIKSKRLLDRAVIDTEESLSGHGLAIREREVAPHNRTRFAVLGPQLTAPTGYDATAMITAPMKDRVGLLYDILGEFTGRGISILDLRSENDIKTQKLQIYFEVEGHILDNSVSEAVRRIEEKIIQEPDSMKVLGSFPRVEMRPKNINKFGFIGTGEMSRWFAKRLENEGYQSILSGRSSEIKPEEMIPTVEVVVICVPISATQAAIKKYAPMLIDGQALILLAGEAENSLRTALEHSSPGVELMLVHNLWGPQASTMKDKNAAVVRTSRSGSFCSEFEAFLYKHGADIIQDTPSQHDLLIGINQKLPTMVSVALAMTLKDNRIPTADVGTHSTLTSLYGILAMARVHTQNPRTYAEIMATMGESRKIVKNFTENLLTIIELADSGKIDEICTIIENNRAYFSPEFLQARMKQALAVDDTLVKMI